MKRKNIIIAAGVTVAITSTALIANRRRKKKMIEEIERKITGGIGETGTPKDIAKSQAFNPDYWRGKAAVATVPKKSKELYLKSIDDIHGAFGRLYDNEEKVVDTIKLFGSKAEISVLSYTYQAKYKKRLGDVIVDRVDKGDNLQRIHDYIVALPNY